jgi:ammonium transporter Rh
METKLHVNGYVVIQPRLQALFKIVDTRGVHNLHGMPGLLDGIMAIFVVPGIAKAQPSGIVITVLFALISGVLAGYLIRATGS